MNEVQPITITLSRDTVEIIAGTMERLVSWITDAEGNHALPSEELCKQILTTRQEFMSQVIEALKKEGGDGTPVASGQPS